MPRHRRRQHPRYWRRSDGCAVFPKDGGGNSLSGSGWCGLRSSLPHLGWDGEWNGRQRRLRTRFLSAVRERGRSRGLDTDADACPRTHCGDWSERCCGATGTRHRVGPPLLWTAGRPALSHGRCICSGGLRRCRILAHESNHRHVHGMGVPPRQAERFAPRLDPFQGARIRRRAHVLRVDVFPSRRGCRSWAGRRPESSPTCLLERDFSLASADR